MTALAQFALLKHNGKNCGALRLRKADLNLAIHQVSQSFANFFSEPTDIVKFALGYECNQRVTAMFNTLLHNPLVASNPAAATTNITYAFTHAVFRSNPLYINGSVTVQPGGNIDKRGTIAANNHTTTITYVYF